MRGNSEAWLKSVRLAELAMRKHFPRFNFVISGERFTGAGHWYWYTPSPNNDIW